MSQKNFLGLKYFKILHENIRDIPVKMIVLYFSRYIFNNVNTYVYCILKFFVVQLVLKYIEHFRDMGGAVNDSLVVYSLQIMIH